MARGSCPVRAPAIHEGERDGIDSRVRLERRRLWRRHSRQLFVAHRRVIDEGRDDHGGLLQIGCLNRLEYVHVRVMRARFVVDRVLDELERRQADMIEVAGDRCRRRC